MPVGGVTEANPAIDLYPPALTQTADAGGRTPVEWEKGRVEATDVGEALYPGFRYLDEAMKLYWSDIRIPTRDSVRFIRARISGGNKALQAWRDDLQHGRLQLPVIAISRGSHQYNPEKFSPPHHPMSKIHTNKERGRVRKVFRPAPYLVEYTINLWAETKRDAEYALHQMLSRFNPLVEFRANDGHVVGTIQLRFGGSNDASEKDAPAEQLAKIKYELTVTAEAWVSLPDQIVPTVLGIFGGFKVGPDDSVPFSRTDIVVPLDQGSGS